MSDPYAPPDVPEARSLAFFFRGQLLHLGALLLLVALAYAFAAPALGPDALGGGTWLGLTDTTWFVLCLAVPVAHQLLVWVGWRSQLGWRLFTRSFGRRDLTVWGALFLPLLVARPLVVIGLAIADAGSSALPSIVGWILGGLLLLPCAYTLFSVARYFGVERALGADHFRERSRHVPFVKKGAFRWSPNAMYVFAFLGLWSAGLLTGSLAALAAAFFQHAWIWAHYVGTEAVDMELLYGEGGAAA